MAPQCGGTPGITTSSKRFSRASFDVLQALLSSQSTPPAWRAAVYERFNPSPSGSSGAEEGAEGGSSIAITNATEGRRVFNAIKGVGTPIRNQTSGALVVPVWWSLWNQGGVRCCSSALTPVGAGCGCARPQA